MLKGFFSIKSAHLLEQEQRRDGVSDLRNPIWGKIWRLELQNRLRLMMWKLVADALPLRGKMASFLSNPSGRGLECPLCGVGLEMGNHLFLACPISQRIWSLGRWPLRTAPCVHMPLLDWLNFVLEPRNLPLTHRDEWQQFILYVAVVIDSIWFTRNMVVHNQKEVVLDNILAMIHRRFDEQMYVWYSLKERPLHRWIPPAPNIVIVNGDVAISDGKLIFAMVSRDNKGEILAARAGTRVGTSPLKGEALALRLGVLLAEDHCWETAIFQSDSGTD